MAHATRLRQQGDVMTEGGFMLSWLAGLARIGQQAWASEGHGNSVEKVCNA
jgi:hypothetical protein